MTYLLWSAVVVLLGWLLGRLHRAVPRFGYGPLFLAFGGLEVMMYVRAEELTIPGPWPFAVSSVVLFPVLMAGLALVYALDGTDRARLLFGSFVAVTLGFQLFNLAMEAFERLGIASGSGRLGNAGPVMAVASLLALVAGLAALVTAYQAMANARPASHGRTALLVGLLAGLVVDAVLFPLLAFGGGPEFVGRLAAHLAGKGAAAILLMIPISLYLRSIGFSPSPRPIFDFFLPPWDTVSRQLRGESSSRVPQGVLYWFVANVGRQAGLSELARAVVREAIHALDVDRGWIFLPDPADPSQLVSVAGPSADQLVEIRFPIAGESLAARCFRGGEPIEVADVAREPGLDPDLLRRFPRKSMLAVPLAVEGATIGVLVLGEAKMHRRFSATEIALVRALAGHAAAAIRDVRRLEEIVDLNRRLSDRERSLRLLTEQVPAILWTTDRDLVITQSTGRALAAIGLGQGQVVGVRGPDLVRGSEAEEQALASFSKALEGESSSYVTRFRDRIFETRIEPLLGPTGEIEGTVGVANDISERHRAEEGLRESRAELATWHDLLTHDLANFATTLLGLTDRLLEDEASLGDGAADLVRRANRQARELLRLAENARHLVRLREQGLPSPVAEEPVRVVAERVFDLLRSVHFDRPFDAECEAPPDLVLEGLPLLESILVNLVDNAIRHSRRGERPAIVVSAARRDAGFVVVVRGGRPPEPEALAEIFRRYVRGAHSGGSGLGLALVRELLEQAGGTASGRIAPGPDGDRFEVVLEYPGR